uniref:Putative tick transposon n=1 Tax=Rhipicephalus microplus TaxID=6941 RepID=A0A6M2CPI1_RHIMP
MERKRPQHALSFKKKLQILQELDRSGLPKTKVAKKYILTSTLSRIWKGGEKIEGTVKNETFTATQMRTTPYEQLEKVHFLWFKCARSFNLAISEPILEQQAREIAMQINVKNFLLINGWLSHFKTRHG